MVYFSHLYADALKYQLDLSNSIQPRAVPITNDPKLTDSLKPLGLLSFQCVIYQLYVHGHFHVATIPYSAEGIESIPTSLMLGLLRLCGHHVYFFLELAGCDMGFLLICYYIGFFEKGANSAIKD